MIIFATLTDAWTGCARANKQRLILHPACAIFAPERRGRYTCGEWRLRKADAKDAGTNRRSKNIRMQKIKWNPGADRALVWMLAGWWIVNLLQAAFTEPANDEAYYWWFARELAWGYFDHPPMTPLLVKLGSFLDGTLGLRLFFTVLQPLYLYIIWKLVRPAAATVRDAVLWFVICAAMPILQLYGFLAVPDVPLLFFTALFLWSYGRFAERDSWGNTLLLGLMMAALAYSKYHGALVVLLTLAANPRLLRNPKLYIAGACTLLLLVPHFLWQSQHDWVSLHYHLSGRNKIFRWNYLAEFLLNVLAVFNPLFWPLYVQAWRRTRAVTPVERALRAIAAGFLVFFTLSALRGYVQPQWVIVIAFSLAALLFAHVRQHPRRRHYVIVCGWITVGLIVLVRLVMIFNPLGLKFEVFDNRASYQAIGQAANGRPVIFNGSYTAASKYMYYTGKETFAQPTIRYRTSQWQFSNADSLFAGREVMVQTMPQQADSAIRLANGDTFAWIRVPNYHPVRKVRVEIASGMPRHITAGDSIGLSLRVTNPYPYPIVITPDSLALETVWLQGGEPPLEYPLQAACVLPAGGSAEIFATFEVPGHLAGKRYRTGMALRTPQTGYWFNSREYKTQVDGHR